MTAEKKRCHVHHHHHNKNTAFFRCADHIFPYLGPSDLAAVSSTSKSLNEISKSITSYRISDASRGFENYPIPFFNSVDSQPYAYFIYTPAQIPPGEALSLVNQRWGGRNPNTPMVRPEMFPFRLGGTSGCDCHCARRNCNSGCPCSSSDCFLTQECGPGCRCNPECGNRVTQKGVSVKLKIVKQRRKGWSLFSGELIPEGQFVCEYAGELLTTEEARRRQKMYDDGVPFSPALLVVKEHFGPGKVCMRMNIDATRIGNIARFINHSCDGGNLSTAIVRCSGALLPRICFFASRDIQENEELTFSYGDARLNSKGSRCFCGSSCCLGVLPSEVT